MRDAERCGYILRIFKGKAKARYALPVHALSGTLLSLGVFLRIFKGKAKARYALPVQALSGTLLSLGVF